MAKLVLYVRCAARKYRIKQYYLFILYLSYTYYSKDLKVYLSRYVLGLSLSTRSISKVIGDLVRLNLLTRVSTDTFSYTPLACDIINYIDSQLSNLESK